MVTGQAWARIKQIAKGEAIEFRTVHTVIGIRGTTLVCESTDTQSTTKVIEGTVIVKRRADNKELTVQSGEMVAATRKGLGEKKKFDAAAENAAWAKVATSSSSGQSNDTKKKVKIGPLSCFIATAAYGSQTAQELDILRAFRDKVLVQSQMGRGFVDTYYTVSPPLAEYIVVHEELRTFVREALLNPVVFMLDKSQALWNN